MSDTLAVMDAKEPKKPKEPTETVRLRRVIVRRAARIAAHKDMTLPDYLAEILAGPIADDEKRMTEDLLKERPDIVPSSRKPPR